MNEDYKINYYAIIPATVRYDKKLKPAEKLLYGEITSLANRSGYCYAQNKYFANLYDVTLSTVSRWISHLQELGYISVEIKRNEKKEIVARHIFIRDAPYCQKSQYPYMQFCTYPIRKNDKDNNININKDDLFLFILNRNNEIPIKFYNVLDKLELLYTQEIIDIMQNDKVNMVKDIIYVLYDLYNNKFDFLLDKISRESLFNLYLISQEHKPSNLLDYYKRSIINKYTNNSTWKECDFMLENYINNFNSITSTLFYQGFIAILHILALLLIISLIILIIGCLVKSQKIKDKFLSVIPGLILGIIFILCIPYIFSLLKGM